MSATLAAQFLELFQGSAHKHGSARLTGRIRKEDGKQEAECRTLDGPATEELWAKHLAGELGLGIIPIRKETNDTRFGAIDIDIYSQGKTLEHISKCVYDANIPVSICRSKSGGVHLYLFTKEWVSAELIRDKLELIAGFLGFADAELFPAQSILGAGTNDGNWINMPYYGGERSLRYGIGKSGKAVTPEEFVSSAKLLTAEELERLSIVEESPKDGETGVEAYCQKILFPDGPPCLESYFEKIRVTHEASERNLALFNCSVYANLRWKGPEFNTTREQFLVGLNNLFPEPLSLSELTKTILQQDKKGRSAEYKYQCSRCPLKNHCHASICRTRPYGIGAYNGSVVRSLSKVDTEPPIWLLTINQLRVSLTTEELHSYNFLQRRVLEVANILLPPMKAQDWQENLRGMLKDLHIIHTFKESTEISEYLEKIHVFLYDRTQMSVEEATIQDVVTGAAYVDELRQEIYFLPEYLYAYLKADDRNGKRKIVNQVLSEYFEAREDRPAIKPRRRCYVVPAKYAKQQPDLRKQDAPAAELPAAMGAA